MNIGFTGHRPNRLGGYSPQARHLLYTFASRQMLRIDQELTVYHGCALGWDMAVATAAIEQGHKVVSCIPFAGFNSVWPCASVLELDAILNKSHQVLTVIEDRDWAKSHAPAALNLRNNYIVDHTNLLYALSCGASSGTQNCVDYALSNGKQVRHLWRDWLKFQSYYSRT